MPLKDAEARREYHRQYMQEYLKDPDRRKQHLARVKKVNRANRERFRRRIAVFRKDGCKVCGEAHPSCLVAHHQDPSKKEFAVGDAGSSRHVMARVEAELAKCICLCMNCHAKHHAGDLKIPGV